MPGGEENSNHDSERDDEEKKGRKWMDIVDRDTKTGNKTLIYVMKRT